MKDKQYKYGNKYEEAFETIGIKYSQTVYDSIIKPIEKDGYNERGICYAISKSKDKLTAFVGDRRFNSVLHNEVKKNSYKINDPRWTDYWDKVNQKKKLQEITKYLHEQEQDKSDKNHIEMLKQNKIKPTGYVYFIQGECGGAIKIGYSTNVADRLKSLQTSYPDKLIILATIRGTMTLEKIIHSELSEYRLNGEWFKPTQAVLEKIKEYIAVYGCLKPAKYK